MSTKSTSVVGERSESVPLWWVERLKLPRHKRPPLSDEQRREAHRYAMIARGKNLGYRKQLSERIRQKNLDLTPSERKERARKIREAHERTGVVPYGRGAGGKGRGMTATEVALWRVLEPMGFESEVVVLTGIRKGEGATWYALDFADRARKIAIEVDGSSHQNRREIDDVKDAFLISQGWTVFRIPAKWAMASFEWVKQQCSPSRRSKPLVLRFSIWK